VEGDEARTNGLLTVSLQRLPGILDAPGHVAENMAIQARMAATRRQCRPALHPGGGTALKGRERLLQQVLT